MNDLACAIHLHSTYSDGTGTVPEIVRAARRAGVDVVMLTDHDTMEGKAFEGWHDDVLLLVGVEVSPKNQNHYLAFGIDEPIDHRPPAARGLSPGGGLSPAEIWDHRGLSPQGGLSPAEIWDHRGLSPEGGLSPVGLSPAEICAAVSDAGGFGFAAHPFSQGPKIMDRPGMPWGDLDSDALTGIELWSFVTDIGESVESWREAFHFLTRPDHVMKDPPERNMREWDRMNRSRRVVGIGGIDAHQFGRRVFGRWVIRLMGYARSFRQLRTHVWCAEPPNGDLEHDRAQVYDALRSGRCYIAADALAPARGFQFWADGDGVHVRTPRPAELRLIRNGEVVASEHAAELDHPDGQDGDRVEAHLGDRTWIVSNPVAP